MTAFFAQMSRQTFRTAALAGAASLLTVSLLAATPARADYCFRLTGGSFSGDLGFLRFKGTRPTTPGQIVPISGRIAGLDPVFGAATVAKDGSNVEFGGTFFADATQGQFDFWINPPGGTTGSGYGSYGEYGLSDTVKAKQVNCANEP